ncbi:hypothetical protein Q5P01_017287 [Channa striata]|uniref:Uncharacterized protein n=1 Tax=Channa striata TaxID=64152 RepID=A0AA88M963_CHASR|nr:hypothetical protein Q5P01_017287 [Channa striata]
MSCFDQKLKRNLPSAAIRVSTKDTSMLNIKRMRQTQKWVPATQRSARQLVIEDDEEHGEAEHQSDLETVAFSASQWQGEADHIRQDDKNAGQH